MLLHSPKGGIHEKGEIVDLTQSHAKSLQLGMHVLPKASKSDRNAGCSGITNTHPTVKPTAILRHLVKLGCPPGGVVGDFFNGSGSTGRAAVLEGFRYVGCELNDTEAEPYVTIARQRIAAAVSESTPTTPPTPPKQGGLFDD